MQGLRTGAGSAFGRSMAWRGESGGQADPSSADGGVVAASAGLGALLAAAAFAALAATVLAAAVIFGLPGAEHGQGRGRGQVTGSVHLSPPPLRH